MDIKHFTWKEIEKEFDVTKQECQSNLDDWDSNVTKDYTMTVEFYPEETLGDDPETIKFAVNDWNKTFPKSAVEYSENLCIILDTIEKQQWGFIDVIKKL